MGFYSEVNDEPESFYVDVFVDGQQAEITQVLGAIGGKVVYVPDASHMGQRRGRYEVTLPAGCKHSGSDAAMAPQVVELPGGRRLCVYPGQESVTLGWLPGDSATPYLWHNATRRHG